MFRSKIKVQIFRFCRLTLWNSMSEWLSELAWRIKVVSGGSPTYPHGWRKSCLRLRNVTAWVTQGLQMNPHFPNTFVQKTRTVLSKKLKETPADLLELYNSIKIWIDFRRFTRNLFMMWMASNSVPNWESCARFVFFHVHIMQFGCSMAKCAYFDIFDDFRSFYVFVWNLCAHNVHMHILDVHELLYKVCTLFHDNFRCKNVHTLYIN